MTTNGSIPLNTRVVAVREQISCDLGGEAVVLKLREGVYYSLNDVASRVWELVQEPRTVIEIRDRLVEVYDVDPDECVRDLRDLLNHLREFKLIELRNGTSI